jgi:flavin reductase (DIM6/NTAB) family NADH-FMN oxidoreductase RutF
VSEFDDLVGQFNCAMVVVTTVADGERAGCLVGFHTQCSIDPPRYAVWLSKANHTYRVALHATRFAVHYLGADDLPVARLFGTTTGDETDKFAQCTWLPGPDGVPVLAACPDHFLAAKVTLLDDGSDHVCVVLEPTAASASGDASPLRLSDAEVLDPGHEAQERPRPATERSSG